MSKTKRRMKAFNLIKMLQIFARIRNEIRLFSEVTNELVPLVYSPLK